MSLGMPIGARKAALDSTDDGIEAQAAAAARCSLQDPVMAAVTTLGVILSSVLAVAVFLR